MTVYTTPDPVYPDEDEFLADGDSYFTGNKEFVWNEAEGYYEELTQPSGT
jgi:hypothetical protein